MKIRVHYNISLNVTEIYATDDFPGTEPRYYTISEGRLLATKYERGERIKPMLEVEDTEFLRELARQISGIMPVEHATQAHLKDAIAVRDRLLTVLEKV